jgi:hypothetical protein
VVPGAVEVAAVELAQQVELCLLQRGAEAIVAREANARRLGCNPVVADGRALIDGGQEGVAVVAGAAPAELRADRHHAGQALILAAQPIGDPGAHRRADQRVVARVQLDGGLPVIDAVGVHAVEHAQLVRMAGDVRE